MQYPTYDSLANPQPLSGFSNPSGGLNNNNSSSNNNITPARNNNNSNFNGFASSATNNNNNNNSYYYHSSSSRPRTANPKRQRHTVNPPMPEELEADPRNSYSAERFVAEDFAGAGQSNTPPNETEMLWSRREDRDRDHQRSSDNSNNDNTNPSFTSPYGQVMNRDQKMLSPSEIPSAPPTSPDYSTQQQQQQQGLISLPTSMIERPHTRNPRLAELSIRQQQRQDDQEDQQNNNNNANYNNNDALSYLSGNNNNSYTDFGDFAMNAMRQSGVGGTGIELDARSRQRFNSYLQQQEEQRVKYYQSQLQQQQQDNGNNSINNYDYNNSLSQYPTAASVISSYRGSPQQRNHNNNTQVIWSAEPDLDPQLLARPHTSNPWMSRRSVDGCSVSGGGGDGGTTSSSNNTNNNNTISPDLQLEQQNNNGNNNNAQQRSRGNSPLAVGPFIVPTFNNNNNNNTNTDNTTTTTTTTNANRISPGSQQRFSAAYSRSEVLWSEQGVNEADMSSTSAAAARHSPVVPNYSLGSHPDINSNYNNNNETNEMMANVKNQSGTLSATNNNSVNSQLQQQQIHLVRPSSSNPAYAAALNSNYIEEEEDDDNEKSHNNNNNSNDNKIKEDILMVNDKKNHEVMRFVEKNSQKEERAEKEMETLGRIIDDQRSRIAELEEENAFLRDEMVRLSDAGSTQRALYQNQQAATKQTSSSSSQQKDLPFGQFGSAANVASTAAPSPYQNNSTSTANANRRHSAVHFSALHAKKVETISKDKSSSSEDEKEEEASGTLVEPRNNNNNTIFSNNPRIASAEDALDIDEAPDQQTSCSNNSFAVKLASKKAPTPPEKALHHYPNHVTASSKTQGSGVFEFHANSSASNYNNNNDNIGGGGSGGVRFSALAPKQVEATKQEIDVAAQLLQLQSSPVYSSTKHRDGERPPTPPRTGGGHQHRGNSSSNLNNLRTNNTNNSNNNNNIQQNPSSTASPTTTMSTLANAHHTGSGVHFSALVPQMISPDASFVGNAKNNNNNNNNNSEAVKQPRLARRSNNNNNNGISTSSPTSSKQQQQQQSNLADQNEHSINFADIESDKDSQPPTYANQQQSLNSDQTQKHHQRINSDDLLVVGARPPTPLLKSVHHHHLPQIQQTNQLGISVHFDDNQEPQIISPTETDIERIKSDCQNNFHQQDVNARPPTPPGVHHTVRHANNNVETENNSNNNNASPPRNRPVAVNENKAEMYSYQNFAMSSHQEIIDTTTATSTGMMNAGNEDDDENFIDHVTLVASPASGPSNYFSNQRQVQQQRSSIPAMARSSAAASPELNDFANFSSSSQQGRKTSSALGNNNNNTNNNLNACGVSSPLPYNYSRPESPTPPVTPSTQITSASRMNTNTNAGAGVAGVNDDDGDDEVDNLAEQRVLAQHAHESAHGKHYQDRVNHRPDSADVHGRDHPPHHHYQNQNQNQQQQQRPQTAQPKPTINNNNTFDNNMMMTMATTTSPSTYSPIKSPVPPSSARVVPNNSSSIIPPSSAASSQKTPSGAPPAPSFDERPMSAPIRRKFLPGAIANSSPPQITHTYNYYYHNHHSNREGSVDSARTATAASNFGGGGAASSSSSSHFSLSHLSPATFHSIKTKAVDAAVDDNYMRDEYYALAETQESTINVRHVGFVLKAKFLQLHKKLLIDFGIPVESAQRELERTLAQRQFCHGGSDVLTYEEFSLLCLKFLAKW